MLKKNILKIWFWKTFVFSKNKLPTKTTITNPKMKYEIMSGAIIWDDEDLWDLENHHLLNAFKYVINHRMKFIVGPENDVGYMHSYHFDKEIYEMAKKHFPNWIGFEKNRCSYNQELAKRIMRVKKVADWKLQKLLDK